MRPAAGGASVVVIAGSPAAEASISRVTFGEADEVSSLVTLAPTRSRRPRCRCRVRLGSRGRVPVRARPHGLRAVLCAGQSRLRRSRGRPASAPDLHSRRAHRDGPRGAAPGLQYWTSRGFAVIDVNYAGSTGYGRAYRDALRGEWGSRRRGCVAAARWSAEQGRVDAARLCIRGGSAGGYTTLAALAEPTPRSRPAATTTDWRISRTSGRETHKFESRYLDSLIAPYPEGRDVYRERSPIHHVDAFHPAAAGGVPGLDDEVVPPEAQSQMIVDALRTEGVPGGVSPPSRASGAGLPAAGEHAPAR